MAWWSPTNSAMSRRMAGIALFASVAVIASPVARPAAAPDMWQAGAPAVRPSGPQGAGPAPNSYVPVRLAVIFGGNLTAVPEEIDAAVVTGAFFPDRVQPVVGRFLSAADGSDDAFQPVVISHGLFLSRFGGDIDALATPVLLAGQRLSVVGVAPASFSPGAAGWLWLPRLRLPDADPLAAAVGTIDGVWDAELSREGTAQWPADEPQRPLATSARGRLSLAAVRMPACSGCVALRGTVRVPFENMLPEAPPVTFRLLPERPAGDESRALGGLLLPGGRVDLTTTSGRCQRCGEVALLGAILGEAVSGTWSLETAASSRPGERGTFVLRRVQRLAPRERRDPAAAVPERAG